MNANDWVRATGGAPVGRDGRRPVHPRFLEPLATKSARPLRARPYRTAASRRLAYEVARLTAPDTPPRAPAPLRRAPARSLSDYEYLQATPQQRAASDGVKQRFRRSDLG